MLLVQYVVAAVSAVFAGLAAIGLTACVEKFGGLIGGVASTLPSLIVPSSIGIALSQPNAELLVNAFYSAPAGTMLTAGFLLMWLEIPHRVPFSRIRSDVRRVLVLAAVTALSWLLAAVLVFVVISALRGAGVSMRAIGLTCAAVLLSLALAVLVTRPVPTPAASRRVPWYNYMLRGLVAMLFIGLSVLVSNFDGVAGGIMAQFPSISFTSMVFLHLTHGAGLPRGAIGPSMLGLFSVVIYAVLFAELFAPLSRALPDAPMAVVAIDALCAWVGAVGSGSVPAFLFVRWLRQRQHGKSSSSSINSGPVSVSVSGSLPDGDTAPLTDAAGVDEGNSSALLADRTPLLLADSDGDAEDGAVPSSELRSVTELRPRG